MHNYSKGKYKFYMNNNKRYYNFTINSYASKPTIVQPQHVQLNFVVDPKTQQQSELTHVVTLFKYSKYECLGKLFKNLIYDL
jgi:hypothetical protein